MQNGWRALKAGDIVDVIAPGYLATEAHLQGALVFLKSWGLVPRIPHSLFGKDLLCSNRDENRFEHFKAALLAKDSKAIWCLRGGYGSIRLIPELVKLRRPNVSPKLFIGISDITSLHLFLNQAWGWPTVHGPLLDRLGRGAALPRFEKEMCRFVFGEDSQIEFTGLRAMNEAARNGTRKLRAPVSGGNLVVLQSSMGGKAAWQTEGRILFFEEVGERGYRVDRILEQFSQAGMFDRAKAIIFGQFTEGHEPASTGKKPGHSLVPAVLKRFAQSARLPVYSGLASGHDVIQRPLPLNTPATLQLGVRGTLICATGLTSEERR